MTTALITGASQGIGRQFALTLAARGHDLVLVARDAAALEALAAELTAQHGVKAVPFVADLAVREQVQWVADRLADDTDPVEMLVNNAGFGLAKDFLKNDIADEERLVAVLVEAVLVLSHAAALAMSRRGHGRIVNVASVAAFASMGTYSAAKAWCLTFTEGLAEELRGTGVGVVALCPGFTHTQFHDRARMNMSKVPEAMWLDADQVVADCLDDLAAGRTLSVPGWPYKLLAGGSGLLPRRLRNRVSARISSGRRPDNRL